MTFHKTSVLFHLWPPEPDEPLPVVPPPVLPPLPLPRREATAGNLLNKKRKIF